MGKPKIDSLNPHPKDIFPLILVAEDDADYGQIYMKKLSGLGYTVQLVKNGQEAIEAIKKKMPALLILDLVMPLMDGFEVLREIKADSNLDNMKIIIVTNLGQPEDIAKGLELGADDYLIKANFSIDDVVRKIIDLLSK